MSNDGTLVRGKLFSFESLEKNSWKRKSIICSKDRYFPVRCFLDQGVLAKDGLF